MAKAPDPYADRPEPGDHGDPEAVFCRWCPGKAPRSLIRGYYLCAVCDDATLAQVHATTRTRALEEGPDA